MRSLTRLMSAVAIPAAMTAGFLGFTAQQGSIAHAQPASILSLLGSEASMGSAPSSSAISAALRAGQSRNSGTCTNHPDAGGWLSTQGTWVIDQSNNCKVRLEGVNWYGMQTQYYVPAGLDYSSYGQTLDLIASLGFNSIRIPMSDQLVKDNSSIKVGYACPKKHETPPCLIGKSRELFGLHPLDVLDLIVARAQADGLWVILDNHDSAAVTKSEIYSEQKTASPVWYGQGFKQKDWIKDWTTLASRYSAGHYCGYYPPAAAACTNTPTVAGFDLRNEPHTRTGPWNMKSYLKPGNGSVWGPCTPSLCGKYYRTWVAEGPNKQWGSNWPIAATTAANAVLSVNPDLLMIVEGTQLYPNVSAKHPTAVDSYWWGSILKGAQTDPITLATPAFDRQLVYSPHEWGPWKFDSPQFYSGKAGYAQLASLFNSQWGFLMKGPNAHPIWLGEFNTCNGVPPKSFFRQKLHRTIPRITKVAQCTTDTRKNSEGLWWTVLIKFLQQNPQIGWSYYPFNSVNSLDEPSNNSLAYRGQKLDQAVMTSLTTIEGVPPQ